MSVKCISNSKHLYLKYNCYAPKYKQYTITGHKFTKNIQHTKYFKFNIEN